MVDITHKSNTLRHAKARASVMLSSKEAMTALKDLKVPKGNVFESARVAALYAAKKTAEMIPDCHPLPVEYTHVDFSIEEMTLHCDIEIKTIYKTGVEVEAMHAASIAALTVYDMLKPLDKDIHIRDIHLLWKKGGKTDKQKFLPEVSIKTSIIVCSDSISAGNAEDKSGKWLKSTLSEFNCHTLEPTVVSDDPSEIEEAILEASKKSSLIILSGGTGLNSRDNTRIVLEKLITKELSGIRELARNYSNERMPFSFLSESMSGLMNDKLIISMPGSSGAVRDYTYALFPEVLHVFKVLEKGYRH